MNANRTQVGVVAKKLLNKNGINCRTASSQSAWGKMQAVKVLVAIADIDRATELLAELSVDVQADPDEGLLSDE